MIADEKDEFYGVLLTHAARYPLMECTDVIKLAYQSEFGGGHMIRDPQSSLERLRTEYASVFRTELWPGGVETVALGDGKVRVDLHTLDVSVLSLEMLNDVFVRSANSLAKGNREGFYRKLALIRRGIGENVFGFSAGRFEACLTLMEAQNFPVPSHSSAYRAAYAPAYRVVEKSLLEEALKN